MKNIKQRFFTILALLLSFIIVLLISVCLFYTPCLSYYNEDEKLLHKYFDAITSEPAFTEASADYRGYYPELEFNYGDAVLALSKYEYTLIPQKAALTILKNNSLDQNAHQVNLILYSYAAKQIHISNIVYFEYEQNIYAIAFFYDDNAFVGEYRAVFKTNMEQFPAEYSNKVFQNHNLIGNLKARILRATLVRGIKIAIAFLSVEIIVVIIYKIKNQRKNQQNHGKNQGTVRNR